MATNSIIIARTWDQCPPVMYDGDQPISTRVLEKHYREMKDTLAAMARAPGLADAEFAKDRLNQIFGEGKW